jgi:pantoate ligase/cytidylate kinase
MYLFQTVAGLRSYLATCRARKTIDGQIGLVPTMGALHSGHLSLVKRARDENTWVVVSIFVNPLQFGENEDLDNYPRSLDRDLAHCEAAGVDAVFLPSVTELYGTDDLADKSGLFQVTPPPEMMARLCGAYRPGHFEGVATVVSKLFHIVQPDRAYFGQKDAQQLAILKRMAEDLRFPVEVVGCPTVREADGLALSSRNRYLAAEERAIAPLLYCGLQAAKARFQQGETARESLLEAVRLTLKQEPRIEAQYIDLVHPTTMQPLDAIETEGLLAIAAYLGKARLIDNLLLKTRRPIIAIDGPAGSGKTTVTPKVAEILGLLCLDTGAMYRAVTWLALEQAIPIEDEAAIAELVGQCTIRLEKLEALADNAPTLRVWINEQDVTTVIRSPNVTANVSAIAAQKAVRMTLVEQQRAYGRNGGVVMDGRDIGTYVFPDAELKIFLTASVQERARRRQIELKEKGQGDFSLEQLEADIYARDQKDSSRAIAPLRQASDAIEINTDRLAIDAVIDHIVALYREKIETLPINNNAQSNRYETAE